MVKASLSSISAPHFDENAGYPGPTPQDELAADLEQHIKETLAADSPVKNGIIGTPGPQHTGYNPAPLPIHDGPNTAASAATLAGEGETSTGLRVHHDEPAVDPTIAERIRIRPSGDFVLADIYIRECDGTACVILPSGEVVAMIEDQLSRHGAISSAVHSLYQHLMKFSTQANKILAGHLNAYIAKTIDDPTKIVPAGEVCEWPLVDVVAPDVDAITKELQEWPGDEPEGLPTGELPTTIDDLLGVAPEGPAAVEIVALADGEGGEANAAGAEACGEVGVVGLREVDAAELLAMEKAQHLYHRDFTAAKDSYVAASQYRVQLQADVKEAKDEEAKLLEEIGRIENRGWRYYLPEKPKSVATSTGATTADSPAIPSHESTLPPPQPAESPSSPQAGVSGANDHPAPPAGDWQAVDIAALNLKKSLATRLREAGHDTIGKLEKLRGQFEGLLSIDGVGRAKADEIEEALLGWLSKNRDAAVLSAAKEKAVAGEGLALEMAAQGQD